MGHPPSREHSSTQKGGRLSQSQRLSERRKNADQVPKINTPRNQTPIAQHPNPPHCGWDIRPPANIPRRKREGDCPNRSGWRDGQKVPDQVPTIKTQRNGHTRAIAHAYRTADGTSALPPTPTHPTGGRLSQSQQLARRPKSARPSPEPSKISETATPAPTPAPTSQTQAHRAADGTSALPRTFLDAKGRAIVPIAAVVRAAKNADQVPKINTPRNQTPIAQHPNPPHCGWDIRPPAPSRYKFDSR